jgi:CRISPR-associated protein Csb2
VSHLQLTIRFLDARYHGKGDGGKREWPPSPMRLFAALLAGAKSRWSDQRREAFEWLERQPPPAIRASKGRPGMGLLTYVPNNNSDSGQIIRTAKIVQPTLLDEPPLVQYCWEVQPGDESHAQAIAEAARHIRALGWGIDLAIGDGSVLDATPSGTEGLVVFHARPPGVGGGEELRVPTNGSLRSLEDAYRASLDRIRPGGDIHDEPGAPVCEKRVYAAFGGARPFCAFVLQTPDEETVAFRPQQIKELVGMIRHAASCDAVRQAVRRLNEVRPPADAIDVDRTILGHPRDAPGPRLSVLPLPSIGHAHSDGHIRRVILAEPADGDGSLCRLLLEALHEHPLEPTSPDDTSALREVRLIRLAPADRFLRHYAPSNCPARVWSSVTPVLLPGYDDRKQHRGNHQKRLARAEQLVCKAMAQAGCDVPARIEISRVPWWAGSLHVRDYRPREKLEHYPRYHVRLIFDQPITGPLAIGAGRHAGFGVLAACQE